MIRTETRTSTYSADDPLSLALRPPKEESEADRLARLQREHEAKEVSDRIDEELRQEREIRKKQKKEEIQLLLLGQAESGKSTLQKQFQLLYAPATLDEERASWRAIVYFNVIRNVKRIILALNSLDLGTPSPSTHRPSTADQEVLVSTFDPIADPDIDGDYHGTQGAGTLPTLTSSETTRLMTLKLRLSPVYSAEESLAEKLSGGLQLGHSAKRRGGGVYLRQNWQMEALRHTKRRLRGSSDGNAAATIQAGEQEAESDIDKIATILANSVEDIRALWDHPLVKDLIERRKIRLEESAAFFLDDINRVTSPGYLPSTDDILRVRLRTMGVASHSFNLSMHGNTVTWRLYDVGGARGQRHTWIPYFDEARAIIFLAPVSAFDQYLEEDPKTNRIHDSLQLFTHICSNELLKKVHLVLFLNKTDILRVKLEAGISVKKYIPSYGERPNDYDSVIEYFRMHFTQVHRRNNDQRRVLYTHFTSVVDTKTTQGIITNVRDSIFRGYLKDASLV